MTLVTIKQNLILARRDHYAIPLIDIFDQFGVEGTLYAASAKRAPVILGIYSPFASAANGRALAAYARVRAEQADVPVTIMLDHGASVEQCKEVIGFGYTDVMYDGSTLPYEENVRNTRQVVEYAHDRGVAVEAELGHVGQGSDYDKISGRRQDFTDPAMVEKFVAETGVDILAIAFGNAHGAYKGEPKIDVELVREISNRVDVPLVMHGGSGLSDDQFRSAIAAGISKVNVATLITSGARDNMKRAAAAPDANMFSIVDGLAQSYRENCAVIFDVFGTTGKAR